MITRDRIIQVATKLFLQNGVKSVTIARIVRELHTSKRTLYNHFEDKIELLKAVLAVYHQEVKEENESIIRNADNSIEAMARLYEPIIKRANTVNPNFFNDIIHYYPGILGQSYRNTGNFAHAQLIYLANWGIKDGLFLPDMDIEVTAKTVVGLLKFLKDNNQFPLAKYSKERLTFGIMIPYLRGLCTTKGLKIVEKQEELFRVSI